MCWSVDLKDSVSLPLTSAKHFVRISCTATLTPPKAEQAAQFCEAPNTATRC